MKRIVSCAWHVHAARDPAQFCCRAEELVAPYYVFTQAGYDVTVASIKGGKIPVDPNSLQGDFKTEDVKKFWADGMQSISTQQYHYIDRKYIAVGRCLLIRVLLQTPR